MDPMGLQWQLEVLYDRYRVAQVAEKCGGICHKADEPPRQ